MEFAWQLVIKAGLAAALIRSFWGVLANYLAFTKFDLALYLGCLIRGKASKAAVMYRGLLLQGIIGIVLAAIYALIFNYFKGQLTTIHVLIIALGQWALIGALLPVTDLYNTCVHTNMLPSMGAYASHYGYRGMLVYLVGHLVFGLTIAYFFSK